MNDSVRTAARVVGAAAALCAALALAAPGPAPAAQVPEPGAVAVDTFQFKPARLEIRTGARVAWTNHDDVTHTVTSGTPERRVDLFNQTLSGKDAKVEFTFTRAGAVAYFCNRHPHMRGEIVVRD
jgi:plastocyanin